MFTNYLKITIRNLFKDKLHSTINILGLSIGLAIAILMFFYVSNEFSYDNFHEKKDRIYQVVHNRFAEDGTPEDSYVHAPIPFGPALESDIPEIEHAIRFSTERTFMRTAKLTAEERILMADREFFDTFSYPFKYGSQSTALESRYSCVLNIELAEKYFGDADPTGKTIEVLLGEEYVPITVTGVMEELPSNNSIEFTSVMPYDLLNRYEWFRDRQNSWNSWNSPTYILLKENASITEVEKKMIPFWEKYKGEEFAEDRASGDWKFDFQPIRTRFNNITEVRHSDLKYSGIANVSDPTYAYILGGIGLGILLLACINFMNLSVSRASNRTKEIAVRKVVGAAKRNLAYQFWGEAVFVSFIAMLIALGIVVLLLPEFNNIVESKLTIGLLDNWIILAGILLITLTAGLIAGSYPALLMSSIKPVQIFARKVKFGGSNIFTKSLIVLQFSLAIFFILGTLIVSKQLSFIQNKNLGFDKEQVIVINAEYQKVDGDRVMNIMQNSFTQDPDIAGISGISYSFNRGYDRVGWTNSEEKVREAFVYKVNHNFTQLMGLNLIKGRSFDQKFSTDSSDAVIVNQALVKEYEISEPVVGKRLDGFKNRGLDNPVIIGVVEDFHYISLELEIDPVIMYVSPVDQINYIYAKLSPNRITKGLAKLEDKWNEIEPEIPFQYSFLDEDLNKQYAETQIREKVINYASLFAIFIAAIGLFGMSSYSAERRRKEIGIRKVLGASVQSIIQLLGREFALLVIIANLVAWPAAYYVLNGWLENFAYRIDIGIWIFLLGGGIALMIALLTVSYQVFRASNSNPVNSIREE